MAVQVHEQQTGYEPVSAEVGRQVVATATLAPSIHNSQPWRWRLDDGVLELRLDPSRQLTVADPEARQATLSCGAALFHARLALRRRGLVPHVEQMPDPAAPDLLATLTVAGHAEPDADEQALAAAIGLRHTDRRPFDPQPLPPDIFTSLRRAAEAEGAWLAPLVKPDERTETAVLIARADWVQSNDPAYRTELAAWSRTDPEAVDGIPRSAVVGGERRSDFPLRDFDIIGEAGVQLPATRAEHPCAVALGTIGDTEADWLRAGQALAAVLLTATEHGVVASPLGQAIDLPSARALLRHAFGGIGHVQMLLRVGYPIAGSVPMTATPRRPVEQVLTVTAGRVRNVAPPRKDARRSWP